MNKNKSGSDNKKRSGSSGISEAFLNIRPVLIKFLSRFLPGAHDIEDIAQETYLRAFSAEQERQVKSPRAYLFRIAKHIALNELARKSRALTDYIEDSAPTDVIREERTPELQAADQEKLATFCRAVATLPPQCRRAFLLRKVYGLSHKEISEELNISVSTVEKHVASGLLKCSTYMKDRGHTPEPVSRPHTLRSRRGNG